MSATGEPIDDGTTRQPEFAVERGDAPDQNTVVLSGRLSAEPTRRRLSTGSELTAFRLVVRRPVGAGGRAAGVRSEGTVARRGVVDVVECVVWDAGVAAVLATVKPGDRLAVRGSLRRRFARSAGHLTSWFNVEAEAVELLREGQS